MSNLALQLPPDLGVHAGVGIPCNDNVVSTHAWPARDLALQNALMVGTDDVETAILNGLALTHLSRFRADLALAEATPEGTTEWLERGVDEDIANEDENGVPRNSAYDVDRRLDMGPSEDKLIELLSIGPKPEDNATHRFTLSGKVIELRRVGQLLLNNKGHMTHYLAPRKNPTQPPTVFSMRERLRGERGARQNTATVDVEIAKLYTGAVMPQAPKRHAELFIGATVNQSDTAQAPRPHHNDNHVMAGIVARDTVDFVYSRFPHHLWEALCLAAGPATMQRIGEAAGYKHKPASAVGKDRVRTAIGLLISAYADLDRINASGRDWLDAVPDDTLVSIGMLRKLSLSGRYT